MGFVKERRVSIQFLEAESCTVKAKSFEHFTSLEIRFARSAYKFVSPKSGRCKHDTVSKMRCN